MELTFPARPIVQFSDILEVTQIRADFFIGYIKERFSGKFFFCPAKEFVQVRNVGRDCLRPFEISADPFYSESNMKHLSKVISDIETGKAKLVEHELIEED